MGNLDELREQIDNIDKELFLLLKKRFEVVKKVGDYKKANNIAIHDLKREEDVIRQKVEAIGMDKEFVENVYRVLFEQAYSLQK